MLKVSVADHFVDKPSEPKRAFHIENAKLIEVTQRYYV